jgi:hypothetical protein
MTFTPKQLSTYQVGSFFTGALLGGAEEVAGGAEVAAGLPIDEGADIEGGADCAPDGLGGADIEGGADGADLGGVTSILRVPPEEPPAAPAGGCCVRGAVCCPLFPDWLPERYAGA